jgi:hypothetical protein
MKEHLVYKGLQKPLIYKGFKGRYIYWGVGFLLSGFVLAGIVGAVFNLGIGALTMIIVTVGGIYYTSQKQKGGLYDKKRNKNEIYIISNNLKHITKNEKKEKI